MCDFTPGDEVVCVDASVSNPAFPLPALVEGRTYVITAVYEGEPCDCHQLPVLVEVAGVEPDPEWAYAACSFRKVERRNDSLSIEAFLTIKPGFEEPRRKAPAKKRERVQ